MNKFNGWSGVRRAIEHSRPAGRQQKHSFFSSEWEEWLFCWFQRRGRPLCGVWESWRTQQSEGSLMDGWICWVCELLLRGYGLVGQPMLRKEERTKPNNKSNHSIKQFNETKWINNWFIWVELKGRKRMNKQNSSLNWLKNGIKLVLMKWSNQWRRVCVCEWGTKAGRPRQAKGKERQQSINSPIQKGRIGWIDWNCFSFPAEGAWWLRQGNIPFLFKKWWGPLSLLPSAEPGCLLSIKFHLISLRQLLFIEGRERGKDYFYKKEN